MYSETLTAAQVLKHVYQIKPLYPVTHVRSTGQLNWRAIIWCSVLPWWVVTAIVCLLGLKFRYNYDLLAQFLALLNAAVFLCVPIYWIRTARNAQQRVWGLFGVVIVAVACVCGTEIGDYAFSVYTRNYYELKHLEAYRQVDPGITYGEQLLDAGRIQFTGQAWIDRAKAGCYQTRTRFCIAPIVSHPAGISVLPATGSFDFFAVGKDCCNCPDQDFRCGDWNRSAAGGLRMIDEVDRTYYQLAVDQWSATYNKHVKTPIFVYWSREVDGNFRGLRATGFTVVICATLLSFVVFFFLAFLFGFVIRNK